MINFNDVFAAVVGTEGTAPSTDINDPGNWSSGVAGQGQFKGSRYGISAEWFPNVNFATLTYVQAQALAQTKYWDPYQCAQFDIRLGYLVFDAAYNGGRPAQWLQGAVGVLQDGVIGAQTVAAVRSADPLKVAMQFMALRFKYWVQCGAWAAEGAGWINRGAENLQVVAEN